ncbi:MAG: peptide chain release factor N(5)-glutamine methyltransferase, partial [candidate division WOR-3 bacterium]
MTPAELLRSAAGTVCLAEAEYLLGHLLGLERHRLYLDPSSVPDSRVAEFRALLREAESGRPVQYVTRTAAFLDLTVYVDERVFIPRPETELLVTRVFEMVDSLDLAVDYGTGSGCIAVALARRYPKARVVAVDASPDALAVAGLNAARSGVDDRIELVRAADLADPVLERCVNRLQLLVSNPPYVPSERIPELEARVRDHEPLLALDGGPNGTSILSMIAEKGPRLLEPGGLLALELDPGQAEAMVQAIAGASVESDLAGRRRY